MPWTFDQVGGPFDFTEGPAWDGQAIFFTDIPTSRILRYDPQSGETSIFRTGTNEANGLMFDKDGQLYACEGGDGVTFPKEGQTYTTNGRRMVRYEKDGTTTVICDHFDNKRFNSPNDLAFDQLGRMWFTDPRYGEKSDDLELDHQSVYRADPQADGGWDIHRVTFDTTKPNGLLISADMQTLYVAQSDYGQPIDLRAYTIKEDGTAGDCRILHDFAPNRGVDGMVFDTEGHIVATAGWEEGGPGPMIYVFAPDGEVLETHPMPFKPSNCTFGDQDLQSLYVTAGGRLYRARTERKGYLIYPS
jgi:gluconolactonase